MRGPFHWSTRHPWVVFLRVEVLGLAASTAPGKLIEMWTHRPHPSHTESRFSVLSSPGDSSSPENFRSAARRTHWKKVTLKHSLKAICQNREALLKTSEQIPDCVCVLELWGMDAGRDGWKKKLEAGRAEETVTVAVKWNYRNNLLFVSKHPFSLWSLLTQFSSRGNIPFYTFSLFASGRVVFVPGSRVDHVTQTTQ